MIINRGHSSFLVLRAPRAVQGIRAVRSLISLAMLAACLSCTSSSSSPKGEKSIEEIENEKEPLTDNDCLEGEYFDTSTDSCEPMEGQTEHDNSHKGAIDVPKDEVFEEDAAPPPEESLDSELPPEE